MPLVITKVSMKVLIVFFSLLISLNILAQDRIRIKKVYKNSKKKFIISKVDQKKIYIFSNERLKAIAIVKKCKNTSCLAIIKKQKSGFVLNKSHEVLLTKTYITKSSKSQENDESSEIKKENKEEDTSNRLSLIYGGFGGPFSNAIIAGLKTGHNSTWGFDYSAGSIMYPIGNIKMSGITLGIGIHYNFINNQSFKMSAVYAYNMTSVELDFTNINTSATNEKVSLSSHMFGTQMTYALGSSFTTGFSFGYAMTDIKESYAVTASESVSIPFSSGLIYIGFMAGFAF